MSRVYETAIKIGASISKAFKGDTYDAAKALTKLAEATKQLKTAEKAAASFKKLDDEIGRSKARYDNASEALRRLEEAEKAAGGATKESTQWRKAGARAVSTAARQFDRATKAQQKNGEVLRKLGVDTSKLTSEQERLTRALAATERQEKSLGHYEAARKRLFGAKGESTPLVQKAGGQLKGIASDTLFLGTAAVGAGAAMAGLVLKTLHAGDEIGDTADKLGIGAKALQELRYGALQSGAEVGSLDTALAKMAISIGKHKLAKGGGKGGPLAIPGLQALNASNGEGAATVADPYTQIGLKAKELAKLKPEEAFKKIADGMAKLKTHADQAAVAQEIFGKTATEILPFLGEGAAGIEKLSAAADKYGGILSNSAVDAADKADKAMKDAEMAFAGVANTLGAQLLPVATKVFKEFSGWVAANRGQIQQWAEKIATWIETKALPALKTFASEAASFGATVISGVTKLSQLVGGFDNLALAVGALRLAPLAFTLTKIAGGALDGAAAMLQLAAATRAAAAANGVSTLGQIGGLGKLAVGGTAGALGIGAAVLGAGLYGINKFDKAGEERHQLLEDAGVSINKNQLEVKSRNRLARVAKYESQGLSHGQALYAADHGGPAAATPRTGGRGGASISTGDITITVGSPGQLEQEMNRHFGKITKHVVSELAKQQNNQQRTSYSNHAPRIPGLQLVDR